MHVVELAPVNLVFELVAALVEGFDAERLDRVADPSMKARPG